MLAFGLSLIFGLCSFVLPYHTSFWAQPLQALTLITSAYFIYKSLHYNRSFLCYYAKDSYNQKGISLKNNNKMAWQNKGIFYAGLGGLFLGLSVFSHATSIVLIPGFILYCFLSTWRTRNLAALTSFIAVLAIALLLMGFVNYIRFGSFTEFGYGYFGSLAVHDGWRGLVGLLISPGASLLLYFPVSALLPLAAKYMYQKRELRMLLFLFLYILSVSWLDAGTLSFNFEPFAWWGTGWGPRYLLAVLPFITLMVGTLFPQQKTKKRFTISSSSLIKLSLIGLSIAGFYFSLIGTIVWWQYGIVYVGSQKMVPADKDPWNSIVWDPAHSPVVLHTKMLLGDYVAHITPANYQNTSWQWVSYGLAPCSYDIYILCKFGLAPLLAVASVVSFLAVLILKQLSGETFNFNGIKMHYLKSYRKSALRN
jgi:hypothetical protein